MQQDIVIIQKYLCKLDIYFVDKNTLTSGHLFFDGQTSKFIYNQAIVLKITYTCDYKEEKNQTIRVNLTIFPYIK